MSILLEALRKSEKNQRLHEAPTIHTDDQSGSGSEPLQTGPLALLLVVALFASGWFVWHQYQPPAGSYQPPVTLAADKIRAVPEPLVTDQEEVKVAPSDPVANNTMGQQRTPVETFQPEVATDSTPEPTDPVPATATTTTNTSASAVVTPDDNPFSSVQRPTGQPVQTDTETAKIEQPVEAAPVQYQPGEPAPIGYWELPDAIRSDVPEIKFSVLVYATNPADRFVLINGQRLKEGDTAQPGLVVKEITRDGVVFSYRLYQFLVER